MTMTEILTAASKAEATEEAAAVAALLNADQLSRAALGQATTYTAADVLRIGRIVSEYMPAATPKPPVPFGKPIPTRSAAEIAGIQAVEGALR